MYIYYCGTVIYLTAVHVIAVYMTVLFITAVCMTAVYMKLTINFIFVRQE